MDMDMNGKCHIHGKLGYSTLYSVLKNAYFMAVFCMGRACFKQTHARRFNRHARSE